MKIKNKLLVLFVSLGLLAICATSDNQVQKYESSIDAIQFKAAAIYPIKCVTPKGEFNEMVEVYTGSPDPVLKDKDHLLEDTDTKLVLHLYDFEKQKSIKTTKNFKTEYYGFFKSDDQIVIKKDYTILPSFVNDGLIVYMRYYYSYNLNDFDGYCPDGYDCFWAENADGTGTRYLWNDPITGGVKDGSAYNLSLFAVYADADGNIMPVDYGRAINIDEEEEEEEIEEDKPSEDDGSNPKTGSFLEDGKYFIGIGVVAMILVKVFSSNRKFRRI